MSQAASVTCSKLLDMLRNALETLQERYVMSQKISLTKIIR